MDRRVGVKSMQLFTFIVPIQVDNKIIKLKIQRLFPVEPIIYNFPLVSVDL